MYGKSDVRKIMEALDEHKASIDTKEKAKAMLIRIGILTKSGKRSKRYYPDDPEAEEPDKKTKGVKVSQCPRCLYLHFCKGKKKANTKDSKGTAAGKRAKIRSCPECGEKHQCLCPWEQS